MKTLNILQKWLANATRFEKELLAAYASTTVPTLQQYAGAYRTKGKLHCGPSLALRLDAATRQINAQYNKHLPILPAGELCEELGTITSE